MVARLTLAPVQARWNLSALAVVGSLSCCHQRFRGAQARTPGAAKAPG